MITRKTKKSPMKKAIKRVVPQPGDTLPYSEFRGLSRRPKFVTRPLLLSPSCVFTCVLKVAIIENLNLDVLQRDHEVPKKEDQILHKSNKLLRLSKKTTKTKEKKKKTFS